MSQKGGVFWSKEGIRHKVPGLIGGEMLDAEVTDKGILFYRRGTQALVKVFDWESVFYAHQSAEVK